jgi:L-ascorbate metabolism protein UlaG (beta-lactamase superfamily)
MIELTWVGHATNLMDLDGFRIITDPLFTKRVAHLRRRRELPSPDAADVDVALLSHVHVDHIHLGSIRKLRPTTKLIVPRNAGLLMRKAGFTDVTEVVEGDRLELGPATIEVVHAEHKHGRGPHSRLTAAPMGYVVEHSAAGGERIYFPGDTDLFDGMAGLTDIDVALLPIWGWGSTLGTGHLDPTRAATASTLIQPRIVVPIHWGTYSPEDGRRRLPTWFEGPPELFRKELEAINEESRLRVLQPGGSIDVPRS